jgi:hypothetical protein
MIIEVYLHSSKDHMWDIGERIGLTGDALMMFRHACTEVRLELDVDENGNAEIVRVDGRAVAPIEGK